MADKITVGNVEITAVLDMIPPPREATAMFPETTAADWAAHEDALETANSSCTTAASSFAARVKLSWWTQALGLGRTRTGVT